MKAKHNKKKTRKGGSRAALWVLIVALILLLAGALLFWWTHTKDRPDPGSDTQPEQPQPSQQPSAAVGGMEDIAVDLGRGLQLINIGAYTGAYVEDGSDEVVSGVLMIIVKNTGEEAIEYAEISLPVAEGSAQFSASTLLPGASVVLMEKNRLAYTGQEQPGLAVVDTVAVFRQMPTLCQDQLQLQTLDGCINVTNISGQDITGDVVIYYKNSATDLYYGGITYRVRIEGGIKAGEIKQIMANHFSASGSQIVFVTIG